MKNYFKIIAPQIVCFIILSCTNETTAITTQPVTVEPTPTPPIITPNTPIVVPPVDATQNKTVRYLALGDSYTIGESVCETCRFPEQLKKSLSESNSQNTIALDLIARTGWTTTDLLLAIENKKPDTNYDLVSLLIGVNNQFQRKNFTLYEKEFPELVTKAISLVKGNKTNVIVLSIPDYAYTPYGQNTNNAQLISTEIDRYNAFAKSYCEAKSISFINITDITRKGLTNPNLVADDGLHPSVLAYTSFLEFLLPKALIVIEN